METLLQNIINRQIETGLGDLLLEMYHAGYCNGAGLPIELPRETGVTDLMLLIEARHKDEIRRPRGWELPPLLADEIPGWLLAHCERQIALGDAQPPDGWHTAPLKRPS